MVGLGKHSVYLFYANLNAASEWSHSLYKVDLPELELDAKSSLATLVKYPICVDRIDPVLYFPNDGEFHIHLRCAFLGSKFYFLGGAEATKDDFFPLSKVSSPEIYVFDIPKNLDTKNLLVNKDEATIIKMEHLKINPIAFSANGLLYVLSSIPENWDNEEDLQSMKLFECYNPCTRKWTVIENLPPQNREGDAVNWISCNVYPKRQQVVLLGQESAPLLQMHLFRFIFVYDLKNNEWTRSQYPAAGLPSLSFQEVDYDDDYLYGLSVRGPPVKSKTGFVSSPNEWECRNRLVGQDDSLIKLMIPDDTNDEWLYAAFGHNYTDCQSKSLRYLGNGIFCLIATGMMPDPSIIKDYEHPHWQPFARGVTITLFKDRRIDHNCFDVDILHHQTYAMVTPFHNKTKLMGCFLVNTDQLQRKLDERKNKKKKNTGPTNT